jgi:hypothetical protein
VVRLENHDPVTRGLSPLSQRAKNLAGVKREEIAKPGTKRAKSPAVASRVGREEHEASPWVIALLETQSPLEGLSIGNARLRLDTNSPRERGFAGHDGIPSAEVLGKWKRNLGSPAQAGIEPGPQALEQRAVGSVPHRITGGVGLQAQIEAHHRKPRSEVSDDKSRKHAVLESPDLASGAPSGAGNPAKAQARRDAGVSELSTEPDQALSRPSTAAIRGAIPRSHRAGALHGALSSDFAADLSRQEGQRAKERASIAGTPALLPRLSLFVGQTGSEWIESGGCEPLLRPLSLFAGHRSALPA